MELAGGENRPPSSPTPTPCSSNPPSQMNNTPLHQSQILRSLPQPVISATSNENMCAPRSPNNVTSSSSTSLVSVHTAPIVHPSLTAPTSASMNPSARPFIPQSLPPQHPPATSLPSFVGITFIHQQRILPPISGSSPALPIYAVTQN